MAAKKINFAIIRINYFKIYWNRKLLFEIVIKIHIITDLLYKLYH